LTADSKYIEMIEDYLENKLSPDDRYAFVEELSKNEKLRKEVHKHQIAYSIIERGIEESLRKKLEELGKKSEPKEESTYSSGLLIILSFIIIVLLFVVYFMKKGG
jgi:hypothetical protein